MSLLFHWGLQLKLAQFQFDIKLFVFEYMVEWKQEIEQLKHFFIYAKSNSFHIIFTNKDFLKQYDNLDW